MPGTKTRSCPNNVTLFPDTSCICHWKTLAVELKNTIISILENVMKINEIYQNNKYDCLIT